MGTATMWNQDNGLGDSRAGDSSRASHNVPSKPRLVGRGREGDSDRGNDEGLSSQSRGMPAGRQSDALGRHLESSCRWEKSATRPGPSASRGSRN